jgi:hypothetical protein
MVWCVVYKLAGSSPFIYSTVYAPTSRFHFTRPVACSTMLSILILDHVRAQSQPRPGLDFRPRYLDCGRARLHFGARQGRANVQRGRSLNIVLSVPFRAPVTSGWQSV